MRPLALVLTLASALACSGGRSSPGADSHVPDPSTDSSTGSATHDASTPREDAGAVVSEPLYLALGPDLPEALGPRLRELLDSVPNVEVHVLTPLEASPSQGVVLALGDHPLARALIPDGELRELAAEGFVLRSADRGAVRVHATRGKPTRDHAHANLGAAHGAYALLEALGFGFLHPLAPLVPERLSARELTVDAREEPRWRERTMHLHTQHPLELTEVLQGWGSAGPDDEAGFIAMLPEVDRLLEWLVANRQNGLEWFLLWAESWADFADSDERLARLKLLVDRAHAFGLAVGIDAPIAFAQQHSYRLLREQGELDQELAQIRARLD